MPAPSYVRVWLDPDGVNGDIMVDFINVVHVRVAVFRGPDGELLFDTDPDPEENEEA